MRPRSGLLRGKEFIMKDLYTFDATEHEAEITYDDVTRAYQNIFTRIGLPFAIVCIFHKDSVSGALNAFVYV